MFLFEKFDEYFQFNSLFLEISKDFLCICIKQVAFLSGDWKKSLEMRERKWYRKDGLNTYQFVLVSMIQMGFRFDAAKKLSLCETAII